MHMQKSVSPSVASSLRAGPAAVPALAGILALAPRAVIGGSPLRRMGGEATKRARPGVALRRSRGAVIGLALAWLVAPASALAINAYITNESDNTVSVIDTATTTVIGSAIAVGTDPFAVAGPPAGPPASSAPSRPNPLSPAPPAPHPPTPPPTPR